MPATHSQPVVILGGTSGIGLAAAKALNAAGYRAIVCGRDTARADRARKENPAIEVKLADAASERELRRLYSGVSGGEDGSIVAGPFETTPPRLDGGEKEPRRMVLGGASPGCHRGRLNTVGCTPDVAVAAFGHRKRELVSRKKKRVTRKRNGFFLVSSIRGF